MVKILVIEDESHIREELMDWLRFEGYDVIGAADGKSGLEIALREIPDLILSDIAMPKMNGHEVLLEVRSNSHLNHVSFIFITASAERASVRKGMDMGADDYITKPFSHAEVLNAVHSRLESRAAQVARFENQIERLESAFADERERRLLKSRLVAMFSHDFRNPLAAILSSASIIRTYEERLTVERKAKHFDRIEGAVHLLLQMLDDMLMVAEIESGSLEFAPQPLDIASFVEAIIDEFRLIDENNHTLKYHNSLNDTVDADPKLVRQVIANLLSNALKYSKPNTVVNVTLIAKDDGIELTVEDHGQGIPEQDIPYLFEPFHRASNAKDVKGSGLGLAIVRQAVELHGGHIHVESQVDQGTRFVLQLPHLNRQKAGAGRGSSGTHGRSTYR